MEKQHDYLLLNKAGADVLGAIIWCFPTAQNNVAIVVAAGVDNGGVTPFGHRQEAVRRTRGINGIDRHFNRAIGAVFEANRTRETGSKFAVYLRFRSACTDGTHPSSSDLRLC